MDLDLCAFWHNWSRPFIECLNCEASLLENDIAWGWWALWFTFLAYLTIFRIILSLLEEIFNWAHIFWNTAELVEEIPLENHVGLRNGGDLEHLGHLWELVDVTVDVFDFARVVCSGLRKHRFQDIAWSTPRSTSLKNDWNIWVEIWVPIANVCHLDHGWFWCRGEKSRGGWHHDWSSVEMMVKSSFWGCHKEHLWGSEEIKS